MTLTCLGCDEPLTINQEWELIDKSLVGTPATDIQGDYAHSSCL